MRNNRVYGKRAVVKVDTAEIAEVEIRIERAVAIKPRDVHASVALHRIKKAADEYLAVGLERNTANFSSEGRIPKYVGPERAVERAIRIQSRGVRKILAPHLAESASCENLPVRLARKHVNDGVCARIERVRNLRESRLGDERCAGKDSLTSCVVFIITPRLLFGFASS